jgi:transposase
VSEYAPSLAVRPWALSRQPLFQGAFVRVTTLFNKLVRLPGLRVTGVEFEGRNREILVLKVARTFKLLTCPECGTQVRGRFEERAPRRWRHLSVLGHQTFLESPIRRLVCPDCDRVVTEDVPWARRRSNFTRPFEDTVALLAQKLSKTAVCEMMRISWVTVGSIAERVVIEKLDDDRLRGGPRQRSRRLGRGGQVF